MKNPVAKLQHVQAPKAGLFMLQHATVKDSIFILLISHHNWQVLIACAGIPKKPKRYDRLTAVWMRFCCLDGCSPLALLACLLTCLTYSRASRTWAVNGHSLRLYHLWHACRYVQVRSANGYSVASYDRDLSPKLMDFNSPAGFSFLGICNSMTSFAQIRLNKASAVGGHGDEHQWHGLHGARLLKLGLTRQRFKLAQSYQYTWPTIFWMGS